jgi:hypothetical protein
MDKVLPSDVIADESGLSIGQNDIPVVWPNVTILVLNYNNIQDTLETLSSVYLLEYNNFNILLVDNGSDKEVVEEIRTRFPDIEILENGKNLGYAGGNNAGFRLIIERGADYIYLLNNDLLVPPDSLDHLVPVMEKQKDCAACQPLVVYYGHPEKVWSAGSELYFGYPRLFLKNSMKQQNGVITPPFGLVGCAILFRASVLAEIGFFDESLFLMHEETDWCIRAKYCGYSLLVDTDTEVQHKISTTLGRYSHKYLYYISRNWLLVSKEHFSHSFYTYVLFTEFFIRIPYYVVHLVRSGQPGWIFYYLAGIWDGITGERGERKDYL